MIYLFETLKLKTATPRQLETWIALAKEQIVPLYQQHGARLMAAWICSADTLFQVTQVVELEQPESFWKLPRSPIESKEGKILESELDSVAPERTKQLFETPGSAFSESFHTAVRESQDSELKQKYSVAILGVVHDQMNGLFKRNEEALAIGMPLVTTLKSMTGRQNQVVNIWKGDFNEPGYQPPEFFDSIGFVEDWWNWIRSVAPEERLLTVSMLPYSPLQ